MEVSVRAVFFVAFFQPFSHRQGEDYFEVFEQMRLQISSGSRVIVVRAAQRFGHDFIRELEIEQFLGGDFERAGGLGCVGAVLP